MAKNEQKKAAALEALGECPYNWNDWPEEIQAVYDWESHKEAIENAPTIDAIPVEWLREWQDEVGTINEWWPIIERIITVWHEEQEAR